MADGHCFRLPEDGELYTRQIISRCEDFAHAQIWSGIDTLRLRRWLRNFTTPLEQYFAACLLDRLIFRSSKQTCSLARQLFQRSLPDACRRYGLDAAAIDDWIDALKSHSDPGVRVVPVIRDNDPPTKSGTLVVRLLRRHLGLNDRWMIWPWQVQRSREHGVHTFLFADDFLGTGHQFRKFANRIQLHEALGRADAVYAPLMAHSRGLARLEQKLPWLHCTSVEVLDSTYDMFSDSHEHFVDDHTNRPRAAKEYYVDLMIRKRWVGGPRDAFGYGGLSLVLAFEHATPNATLPVVWSHRPGFFSLPAVKSQMQPLRREARTSLGVR